MSLISGANTDDHVNHGSAAGIDNPSSFSVALWLNVTTHTDQRNLISKARPTSNVGWRLRLDGTGGNVRFIWNRATTAQNFITNSAPLVTAGKHYFLTLTTDGTGGNVHIYAGDLTVDAAECTYATATAGSGALTADAARSLFASNHDEATPNVPFQGSTSVPAYWHNRVLTLAEIIQFQRELSLVQSASLKMFAQYGVSTGTQVDLSGNGNDGAVTGMTVGEHLPIGRLWFPGMVGGLRQMSGGMNG